MPVVYPSHILSNAGWKSPHRLSFLKVYVFLLITLGTENWPLVVFQRPVDQGTNILTTPFQPISASSAGSVAFLPRTNWPQDERQMTSEEFKTAINKLLGDHQLSLPKSLKLTMTSMQKPHWITRRLCFTSLKHIHLLQVRLAFYSLLCVILYNFRPWVCTPSPRITFGGDCPKSGFLAHQIFGLQAESWPVETSNKIRGRAFLWQTRPTSVRFFKTLPPISRIRFKKSIQLIPGS